MVKTQACYPDKRWISHTWEHSGYLHPYPTHPASFIIILDLSSGLERAWLKTVKIFPLLIQIWRAKDKEANELTTLMSFQKEKLTMRKEHHHKNARLFLVLQLSLTVVLAASFSFALYPGSAEERG